MTGRRTGADYAACAAEGLSTGETAARLGVSSASVGRAARRHGLTFRDARRDPANAERMRKLHADPEFAAANAERMRKLHADPEFAAANAERSAERMRKLHADGKTLPTHLRGMSPQQRTDYATLTKAGYRKAEALAAMGLA